MRSMIDKQDTQPLPIIRLPFQPEATFQETPEVKYRRLKALSDATEVRFLFVYLSDQRQRLRSTNMPSRTTRTLSHLPATGGRAWQQ
jgi:hypothetical protein